MGMLKEFKDFAMKGSLVDIAIAFVMGGAFGKVVTSLTQDLIAPLVGLLTGKDLSKNMIIIRPKVEEVKETINGMLVVREGQAEVALKWGAFVTAVIDFIIVAFLMFLIIKAINSLKKKEVPPPAATPEDIILLREIRDALRK
jgi:large conductance mechanosensitive channel